MKFTTEQLVIAAVFACIVSFLAGIITGGYGVDRTTFKFCATDGQVELMGMGPIKCEVIKKQRKEQPVTTDQQ